MCGRGTEGGTLKPAEYVGRWTGGGVCESVPVSKESEGFAPNEAHGK
jgi:hypothetical protein